MKDVLNKKERNAVKAVYEKYRRFVEWEDVLQEARLAKLTGAVTIEQIEKSVLNYCQQVSHNPAVYGIPVDFETVVYAPEQEEEHRGNLEEALEIIRGILTERQYFVFYHHVVNGIPQVTIAQELGITHQSVALYLSNAIKKIRNLPPETLRRIEELLKGNGYC